MSTFLEQTIFTAIWKGNLNGVKTLVDANNIECFDAEHHRTPLSWACFYGNKTIVPHLVEMGANIECRDKHERTPLITASYSGHLHTVNYLLDKGAKIEAKDEGGITPLMAACINGFLAVAKTLIKRGADVNAISNDGSTCMSLANKGDFKSIVRLLFENGCNIPQAYQKLGGSNSKSQSQSEDQGDKDQKIAAVSLGSISIEQTKAANSTLATEKPLNPEVVRKPSNYDLAYSSSNSTSFILGPASKSAQSIQPAKSASPISNAEEAVLRQATPTKLEPSISPDEVTKADSPVKSPSHSKETTPTKSEPVEGKQSSPIQTEVAIVKADTPVKSPVHSKESTPTKSEAVKEEHSSEAVTTAENPVKEASPTKIENENSPVQTSTEIEQVKIEIKETEEQLKLAETVVDMTEETLAVNGLKDEIKEIEQEENNKETIDSAEQTEKIEEIKVDLLKVEKVVNSDILEEIAATIAQVAETIDEEADRILEGGSNSEYGEIIEEDDMGLEAEEEIVVDPINVKSGFTSVLQPDSGNTTFKISLDEVDSDDD